MDGEETGEYLTSDIVCSRRFCFRADEQACLPVRAKLIGLDSMSTIPQAIS